jgi:meso-butanediol dehydrogenase/(S,S)-butanediol dehydrogenase/diacetyl reductase
MRLRDRAALITGGTSGIGAATVRLFAREGARVAFTGRRRELGQALAAEVRAAGGQAVFVPADHRELAECERALAESVAALGGLDILFNNAGLVLHGTAEKTTEAEWDEILRLNVTAVWRMSRLALPHFRARGGGVIVNNASDWAVVGGEAAAAYATTKGAVLQLTRSMALDHAREGIRVNAVCPGDTYVERWAEEGYARREPAGDLEASLRAMGQAPPLGRVGRADEIARAVLFLASDDSSFMTGAALVVDGGNTAR